MTPLLCVLVSSPGRGWRSSRQTEWPAIAMARADASPVTPAPMTAMSIRSTVLFSVAENPEKGRGDDDEPERHHLPDLVDDAGQHVRNHEGRNQDKRRAHEARLLRQPQAREDPQHVEDEKHRQISRTRIVQRIPLQVAEDPVDVVAPVPRAAEMRAIACDVADPAGVD